MTEHLTRLRLLREEYLGPDVQGRLRAGLHEADGIGPVRLGQWL